MAEKLKSKFDSLLTQTDLTVVEREVIFLAIYLKKLEDFEIFSDNSTHNYIHISDPTLSESF